MTGRALLLHFVIGFPIGIVVANFGEWVLHKRMLHERGKKKGSFWNFHFYDHHNEARRNAMRDVAYETRWFFPFQWNSRTKEAVSLLSGLLIWVPLLWVVPGFAFASLYATANYYYKHKRAHLDPEWARRKLPWHYDHHMGPDQEANWGVTRPWFDVLLGTRIPYVGTEREAADRARRDLKGAVRISGSADPTSDHSEEEAPSPA